MKNLKIVIIGGTSKFGQLWQRYFESKGHEVIVSSRTTEIKPEVAVTMGDVIIFSISIRHTIKTIRDLVPLIPCDKLIMDFTGIKIEASEEMKKYTTGEIVATHPMFGPWIKSLANQNIAYDPIRTGPKWEYIKLLWQQDEANLIEIESHKHDELVAILQSSVHFVNLLIGHVLKVRDIHPDKLLAISTPNSRMQLFILSRFLNQEASLYTDMQMHNTIYRNQIVSEMKTYVDKMHEVIKTQDEQTFENEFNELKNFVGKEFLDKALGVTNKLDEELKKIS